MIHRKITLQGSCYFQKLRTSLAGSTLASKPSRKLPNCSPPQRKGFTVGSEVAYYTEWQKNPKKSIENQAQIFGFICLFWWWIMMFDGEWSLIQNSISWQIFHQEDQKSALVTYAGGRNFMYCVHVWEIFFEVVFCCCFLGFFFFFFKNSEKKPRNCGFNLKIKWGGES